MNIGRRMAKGAVWMVAMRLAVRGIGLVSTVILARLLLPADFGLVALAMMVFGALEVMGEFGFDIALIRDQEADRRHYDAAWSLQICRGAMAAVLLVLLAGPTSSFFGDERLEPILWCLAGIALIRGFQNIGIVNFRKDLDLYKEFAFLVSNKLIAFVATVSAALSFGSYWALIVGFFVGATTDLALSYAMSRFRPRIDLSAWREIMHFSKWMLANNILYFISDKADSLIIGKLIGPQALGLYQVSLEISNLPTSELVAPIRRALFPGYAKLSSDRPRLIHSYLDGFALMMMIALPLGAGILVTADPLVRVLLGPNWLEAIPLLQVLALYGIVTCFQANSGSMMLAIGRPRVISFLVLLGIVIRVPLVMGGALHAGTVGAAWAMVASAVVPMVVSTVVVHRQLEIPVLATVAVAWRTIVSVTAMTAAVWSLEITLRGAGYLLAPTAELVGMGLFGAALYVALHLGLWVAAGAPDGAERHVLSEVSARLRRWAPLSQS